MKLNLGCGFNKYEGYVNVDSAPACAPDIVWDLEETPWPWEDDSVEEILMEHVLEHLGETSRDYLRIWQEMYRVGKNGCAIKIVVPHWNHDNFHNDPTHKRPVTPEGIELFDQAINLGGIQKGERGTKLGLFLGIDIALDPKDVEYFYSGDIAEAYNRGEFDMRGLTHLRDHQNNISNEIRMTARVVKPARGVEKDL
jgi:hypothetical protein